MFLDHISGDPTWGHDLKVDPALKQQPQPKLDLL